MFLFHNDVSKMKMKESQPNTSAASYHALHVALQTLRERCQFFQNRVAKLEEENMTLRATQTRSPVPSGSSHIRDRNATNGGQSEVDALRASISELTRQKSQLADHISMVAAENKQLWRRVSQIAKEVPSSFVDNEGDTNAAYGGSTRPQAADQRDQQSTASSNSQPGQNLIRSRTFTKNAPNPKLRERLQRDGSSEEEMLNLEDISLLNTCGFLETVSGDLLQLSLLGKQDDEQLQAALEANPDIRRCTEGLNDIRNEILEQEKTLQHIFNKITSKKGQLCPQCQSGQSSAGNKKLMKDVTVEVAESDLLPLVNSNTAAEASGSSKSKEDPNEPPLADAATGAPQLNAGLQEKATTNCALGRMCPMCGKQFSPETLFEIFQQHVESHFLDDSDMGELSLERPHEYISQTVGDS